jgi:hypothetical protein
MEVAMRKYVQCVLSCGFLIGGLATLSAQVPQQAEDAAKKAGGAAQKAGQTAERAVTGDATYGRVKEFKAGEKLVIDINNAPDKSYDLAKEHDVVVAPGLKVGDPVKISESEVAGKKTINIAMDNTPGVEHGDKK